MRYPLSLLCGLVLNTVLLAGCQPDSTRPALNEPIPQLPAAAADTSENALDWPGSYQGVIPCADCPGIKVTVELATNQHYTMSRYYQEGAAEPVVTEGQFRWSSDGRKIQLDDADNSQFLVGENRLLVLNPQGERYNGKLADEYWLEKQPQQKQQSVDEMLSLTGKWQLTELLQKTVDTDSKVFLQFDEAGRVSGYTGCNNLTGGYELQGPRINFTPLATTRKACLQDTIEPQLLDVLSKVDNITVAGDELSLNRARMAPLARLTRLSESPKD